MDQKRCRLTLPEIRYALLTHEYVVVESNGEKPFGASPLAAPSSIGSSAATAVSTTGGAPRIMVLRFFFTNGLSLT